MKSRSLLLSCTLLSCSLSACSFFSRDEIVIEDGVVHTAASLDGKTVPVVFEVIDDYVDAPGPQPDRMVFTSSSAFHASFGQDQDAPSGTWGSEWAFYFAGGMQTTDGHTATILSIAYDAEDARLDVVARFESPGPGCTSHALPELPYALVKFPAPTPAPDKPVTVIFDRKDTLRDCSVPPNTEPAKADCGVRKNGAMITFENVKEHSERFTAWVTEPKFIDESLRLLSTGEQRVPNLKVEDHTDCDASWSWHVDPVDAEWGDLSIEWCDAIPSYIQANRIDWLASGARWCPWGALVVAVDDRR